MFTWEQFGTVCAIASCAIGFYDLLAWSYIKLPEKMLNKHRQELESRRRASFSRVSIPLVRRIFPQLIANNIVSVQPMMGPTGLVHYLRFRYSSVQNVVNEGPPVNQVARWRASSHPYSREKVNWLKEGF